MNRRTLLLGLIVGLTTPCVASERLFVNWPTDWEFRQTVHDDQQVLYLQGRQHVGDRVAQDLAMTVIDTEAASEPITNASIKNLVQRLHRRFSSLRSVSEIRPFATGRGYYSIANHVPSEESDQYKHHIEGVMLDSGYMIEFVLRTKDTHAFDTLTMLSALEKFAIR